MAKKQTQQQQIDALTTLLASHGIRMPASGAPPEHAADYIKIGSDQHRQFLGLVEVNDGDDTEGYKTHKSQHSGKVYRLEDQLGVVNIYPNFDPGTAAIIILKMKINDLEMECADPVADAPPMWDHGDVMIAFGVPGAYDAMEHAPRTAART